MAALRFPKPEAHRVLKNVPPSTCYNFDIHNPITIMFGRSVTEKARKHTMLCFLPHLSSASALYLAK